jgi:hypothetical protein
LENVNLEGHPKERETPNNCSFLEQQLIEFLWRAKEIHHMLNKNSLSGN